MEEEKQLKKKRNEKKTRNRCALSLHMYFDTKMQTLYHGKLEKVMESHGFLKA